MKTMSLSRSIHVAMLAAAFAAPMAFAQDAAPPPSTPMQDSSMQSQPAQSPPADAAPAMSDDKMASAGKPASWKELDTNKDGKLSKDEAAGDPKLTTDFDAADANKDGYLSKSEFKAESKKLAKT